MSSLTLSPSVWLGTSDEARGGSPIRLAPYLCLEGAEIANSARVTTYGACEFFDADCPCPAIEEGFVDIPTDPAPWYDSTVSESEDFIGFLPQFITLSTPMSRQIVERAEAGSIIGPAKLQGRTIEVIGWMVARTAEAMWWGERWLTDTLRGTRCPTCTYDTLQVLPFCRQEASDDFSSDFRTLVSTKLVDGPRWSEVSDDPNYLIATAQFQMASTMPWLYLAPDRCLEDEPIMDYLGTPTACPLTTTEFMDGTFVIDVTAESDVENLVISGKVSLDGDCPVGPPGDSVMPCFTYTIPSMSEGDRIVIDGTRRQASYYDASDKFATSLLPHLDFEGPFLWPDVSICTTVCLTLVVDSGDAVATVDGYLRQM